MEQGSEACRYRVCGVVRECATIATLSLVDEKGTAPHFIAGQYLTVFFPELATPEGKAYSISSAPGEAPCTITIKEMGEFSRRLCSLQEGEAIAVSPPYGFFYPEEDTDLYLIAGGIGITPFRSMVRDAVLRTPKRRITLFHSVRDAQEAIFLEAWKRAREALPRFSVSHFVTGEAPAAEEPLASAVLRRMTAEDILTAVEDTARAEFLLCGSIGFVRDLWRALRAAGVAEERIYTEAFFSH